METLGRNIRFVRKQLGLTQISFGQRLGLDSNSVVSNWEKGKREPSYTNLLKIAKMGNVSLDWLVTGDITGDSIYNSDKEYIEKFNIDKKEIAESLGISVDQLEQWLEEKTHSADIIAAVNKIIDKYENSNADARAAEETVRRLTRELEDKRKYLDVLEFKVKALEEKLEENGIKTL